VNAAPHIYVDFDDAPSMVAFLASEARTPVAVLDRPWNRSVRAMPSSPCAPVHVCSDWSEIARLLPE